MARSIDKAAHDAGIDYVGGFGASVSKGLTASDRMLIDSLPDVFSETERVCSFLNVGTNTAGMNLDAVNLVGGMLKRTAEMTKDGIGCTKFVIFVNAPEDNPFMAGAYHGIGEGDASLNLARPPVRRGDVVDRTERARVIIPEDVARSRENALVASKSFPVVAATIVHAREVRLRGESIRASLSAQAPIPVQRR